MKKIVSVSVNDIRYGTAAANDTRPHHDKSGGKANNSQRIDIETSGQNLAI